MKIKYVVELSIFLIVLIQFCFPHKATAGNGGSAYSRYGIGDIHFFPNCKSIGMGGSSIAILHTDVVDRINPAAISKINRARFSIGMLYEGFSVTDGTQSTFLSDIIFNGFIIALPISVYNHIVLSTGITPYSTINYNILTSGDVINTPYDLNYIGSGGLSNAHIGISTSPIVNLYLGIKMNYIFGTLRHSIKQFFANPQFMDVNYKRSIELRGIGVTLGGIYSGLSNIFFQNKSREFNIGFLFTTKSSLTHKEEKTYSYSNSTISTNDTVSFPKGSLSLPITVGCGFSFKTEKIIIAADFLTQQWSQFEGKGTLIGNLQDSYRASLGLELLPSKDASESLLNLIAYRFGLYYNTTYYKIKNQPINELGFTIGFGFPISSSTRINIGSEYGFRGTTKHQLQKDKILRLSLTLNTGELWFVKPKEED